MELRKCFILVLTLLVVTTFQANVHGEIYPKRPPLPVETHRENQKIMVVVKKESFTDFKKKVKESAGLTIHQTYQNVFHGFSIEGPEEKLKKLTSDSAVLHSSPVVSYTSHIKESVPFIGGEDVRGLFDQGNRRLTGKGVKIAVIDTGVDYNHPDLSRNYRGGYDFIDGDEDPMETTLKGNETIHGTHVAGIIAANGKLKGIAPEAEIIAYRALGPGGMGTSDQVIAAIDKAIKDKVDIINLSLGNAVNGPDWPTSLALDRAVESGIVAVTSSGNSGPGVWTVGSPGTSAQAISVGASSPPLRMPYLKISGVKELIQMNGMQGAKPWEFTSLGKIVYGGKGEKHELDKTMRGKMILIDRGGITFTEKVLNAKEQGAKAVIITNNVSGNFSGALEIPLKIPVVSISKQAGEMIKKRIKQRPVVRTIYKNEEDKLADFSSRGPVTTTWAIKPDVVAPGVSIDSTVPKGYLALHGTSMAAPHVAGACALIKQAHPDWSPKQIKASLMNTATPLENDRREKLKPNEQGTGRINVKDAIEAEVLIYPGSLTFGQYETSHPRTKKTAVLTVDNQSDKSQVITFKPPSKKAGIQWKLPHRVTLNPGEKEKVKISMDLTPNQMEPGIHQEWLQIEQGTDTIDLPYLFVVDEPNYPRVMGFELTYGDHPDTYKYRMYLPGGAEEMGIALYDPDTLTFVGFLDWQKNAPKGLIEKEIKKEDLDVKANLYKAIIFAKKMGQEDQIEVDISLIE